MSSEKRWGIKFISSSLWCFAFLASYLCKFQISPSQRWHEKSTDLMEERPQTQTNIAISCNNGAATSAVWSWDGGGGGVALREGLNGNSLSLWEPTSIHASPCLDLPTRPRFRNETENLRKLWMHLQLAMCNNNNSSSSTVDDLLRVLFHHLERIKTTPAFLFSVIL